MKKTFYILILTSILLSCSDNSKNDNQKIIADSTLVKKDFESQRTDPNSINDTTKTTLTDVKTCDCETVRTRIEHNADLKFSAREFKIDTLLNWDNTKALEISSLMLYDFDTIPLEFNKFKNVETLILGYIDWDTVTVLDVFPKLKRLELRGKFLNLANNPTWLKTIEVIHAEKSKIIGLNSFKQTPNLVEFKIGFSGFDKFPLDFNSLKCLQYFQTGAHTHGTIDLTEISLENMPCLKFVEFHSWRDNLSGIPQGIDSIRTVKIHHANLTKEEKLKLKRG